MATPNVAFLLGSALACHTQVAAQSVDSSMYTPVVRLTTQEDHRLMMEKLQIKELRPGANGRDLQAPNAANYDESKVIPVNNLPDPLVMNSGKKVTSERQWWKERRPEIVEFFDREIYGRVPTNAPAIHWETTSTTEELNGDVKVLVRKLLGHADNRAYPLIKVAIELTVVTPLDAKSKVPLMMEFSWVWPAGTRPPQATIPPPGPTWQQQVLAKGWGYATIIPVSIQADNGAGLTQGIIGLMNKGQPRKPDDWGALRAWAWGASRALDYLETDRFVDATQVGLEGHSRYGKAVAVAMAYDERFAIAFVSSSGEGGLKLHRRNYGELVENVAGSGEYHWMAGNFIKYAGPLQWSDLPVDAHSLVALCAPRPVFISAGDIGDQWVDPRGSFLAGVYAGPVYRLLGKKGLETSEYPKLETGLMDGEISFRQHSGGHTPGPNWPTFLTWADRYIKVRK